MEKKHIDATLVFLTLSLVIFGLIMMSSVSVYWSNNLTTKLVERGILGESNNYYYLIRHIKSIVIGIFALIIASKIPYSLLEKYAKVIFGITFGLLIAVLFIGEEYNGAKWWLNIPLLPSIQPVEFMKIWLVIMLAYFAKKKKHSMCNFFDGFVPFFFIAWIVFLLLILQPDFGSILIIAPVVIGLYFVWGGGTKYLGISFLICSIGAASVYWFWKIEMKNEAGKNTNPLNYISQRIDNFIRDNKELIEKPNPDGKDYQTKQGLIAIGSGGFFGLGFGKSIQKFGYLPEVQWDFIFSVIVEELGFFGAFILIGIYLTIVYRWFLIAKSVKDIFAQYVAFGITLLIFVQAGINIGVNLNIVPLTWVTLPFVSYGGSSLLSMLICIGILLSISRHREYKPQKITDIFSAERRIVI
jgi:cell division protein FtsW